MLRNPNTIPADDTIIEDPAMEPYFITNSTSGGYTVYERVTKGKDDRAYLRTVCYPSTFNHALKVVAREKLLFSDKKHYKTVKDYITAWNSIKETMQTMTTIE